MRFYVLILPRHLVVTPRLNSPTFKECSHCHVDHTSALDGLPSVKACDLVKRGGLLILSSPYTWKEEHTEVDKWIGGKYREDGWPKDGRLGCVF